MTFEESVDEVCMGRMFHEDCDSCPVRMTMDRLHPEQVPAEGSERPAGKEWLEEAVSFIDMLNGLFKDPEVDWVEIRSGDTSFLYRDIGWEVGAYPWDSDRACMFVHDAFVPLFIPDGTWTVSTGASMSTGIVFSMLESIGVRYHRRGGINCDGWDPDCAELPDDGFKTEFEEVVE